MNKINRTQEWKWALRRWSMKHVWYRLLLPARRRRWQTKCINVAGPFEKQAQAQWSPGPALVIGDFSGTHGLSRAAAYDLKLIEARHDRVDVFNINQALAGKAIGKIDVSPDIANVYFLCQPDTLATVLPWLRPQQIVQCYRIARWVWETPLFPAGWLFAEKLMHEVWTPSEFCAETFRKALAIPVIVKPYPVPEFAAPPQAKDWLIRYGITRPSFVGLAIMDLRTCPERKNPWDHIRAWQLAFAGDPSAILILKTRVSRRTHVVLTELHELIGDAKNILVLNEDMTPEQIASLQEMADVYISLHRSEGYGLNIHEAIIAGNPVLATNWSANAEYGPGHPSYQAISYTLVPYRDWTGHYADASFCWAQADVAEAAHRLLRLRSETQ